MICYKDRTYCKSDCVVTECYRYLSKEESIRASSLGLPLALSDFSVVCSAYKGVVEDALDELARLDRELGEI